MLTITNPTKCTILIGPIASGKSTFAKERATRGSIIINDDSIVEAVHAGDYTLYNKSLKPLYKAVETAIFVAAVTLGKDVIVDRGLNVSQDARKRWIGLARAFDCQTEAVYFFKESPEVHAQRRFKSDPRGKSYDHWLEAARRHDSVYSMPSFTEGFDVITRIDEVVL